MITETWQWWVIALGVVALLSALWCGYYYCAHHPSTNPSIQQCAPASAVVVEINEKLTRPNSARSSPSSSDPSAYVTNLSAPPPQFFLDQKRWPANMSISPPSLERQQHLTRENHRFLSLSPFLGHPPTPSPVSTVQTRTPSPSFTRWASSWSTWKRET